MTWTTPPTFDVFFMYYHKFFSVKKTPQKIMPNFIQIIQIIKNFCTIRKMPHILVQLQLLFWIMYHKSNRARLLKNSFVNHLISLTLCLLEKYSCLGVSSLGICNHGCIEVPKRKIVTQFQPTNSLSQLFSLRSEHCSMVKVDNHPKGSASGSN